MSLTEDELKPREKIFVEPIQCVPYQLCPKCGGRGIVYDGETPLIRECDVCLGRMVIPMHVVPKQ